MKSNDNEGVGSTPRPCTALKVNSQTSEICSVCIENDGMAHSSVVQNSGNTAGLGKETKHSIKSDNKDTRVDGVGVVLDRLVSSDSPENGLDDYLPENLKILMEGQKHGLPVSQRIDKPNWFDPYKFKAGQEFAMKYYFGVNFAEMLSLLILFSFDDSLKALAFTDQSGTPMASFKRYLSTVLRVKTWYEEDVFDSDTRGYSNIKIVQAMHSSVSKTMNESSISWVDARVKELNCSKRLVCPSKDQIKEDFGASLCPFIDRYRFENPGCRSKIYFNQLSMSITQFGFLGLIVLYPEKFGAANATDQELEGFVHLWRVLGRLLGVDDRYNFCNGTLDQVKARCRDLLNYWAVPNFTNLSAEWEHFSRCLVKGVSFYVPGNSFDVSILYLCFVLGINGRKFYAKVTWSTYLRYLLFKFVLCFALRLPYFLKLANRSLQMSLVRAKHYSGERLLRIERDSDEFMGLC